MGPFTYQSTSPFSSKPTGFISGAGHSSTFQSADGRWWHASTIDYLASAYFRATPWDCFRPTSPHRASW